MRPIQSRTSIGLAVAAAVALVTAAPAVAGATGFQGRSGTGTAVQPQSARAGLINTIVGGTGGPGTGRTIAAAGPCGVTSDGKNLYFTDASQDVVRRLNQGSDALSTVAGTGPGNGDSGPGLDRKSTRLNSSHLARSRMPSSA